GARLADPAPPRTAPDGALQLLGVPDVRDPELLVDARAEPVLLRRRVPDERPAGADPGHAGAAGPARGEGGADVPGPFAAHDGERTDEASARRHGRRPLPVDGAGRDVAVRRSVALVVVGTVVASVALSACGGSKGLTVKARFTDVADLAPDAPVMMAD